ncbi:PAS domain S-box protein [Nonlabens marinus]|uniref:histidine kinase n=1 Tax=Nonlabens marinus S1-08 TaxID=1454201 RepID=W8VWD6_9FLAO|nr:PAS domain S-box protein [Nonlabens marinus]BAO56223.1 sensory box/GGDEF domain protein [Nonlabens marinus S1-08]
MDQAQLTNIFLDQSEDLLWIINLDLQLIYANKRYFNLIKEVTGKELNLYEPVLVKGFGEGYMEKWKNYYSRALQGECFNLEEHYSHPESNEIHYGQITLTPLKGDDQEIFAIACKSRDITRIVKQKSEANQLIDASLDVFCTINEKGNFVFVSAASIDHWGYTVEELVGKPYVDFIKEEDLPKTEETAAAILNGQDIKSFINRYKKKCGGIAYNLWSVHWDKTTQLMYCVVRDAKEIIEQETKIQQSEQRFKALVQEGADMIAILDAEANYKYASPTSLSVLGIPHDEFIGRNAFEFIHPEDAERASEGLNQLTTQNRVVLEPFRFKNHKDEWRWLETVLTNMTDNPAVNGIVSNSRDITYKIEKEHTLKLLESVITNTKDAILMTKVEPVEYPGPKIIYVNQAFTEMTGYEAKDVIGKTPRILHGRKTNPEELARIDKALINLEPCETTIINYKKSGEEFWNNFTMTPVANEKGLYTHWVAVERDVTEEKKLRELNQQASRLAKIGSWEIDIENQSLFWSDKVHEIHGTDPNTYESNLEEAINFYRKDFRPMVQEAIQESITSGNPFDFEAVIVSTDKTEIWVRANGVAEMVDGKCTRLYGSVQDINDRKEAEVRLQSLADNLPGVVYQYQIFPDGTDALNYVSGSVEQLCGYTAAEIKENFDLIWNGVKNGGDFEEVQADVSRSIETKTRWNSRFRYMMPSGEFKTFLGTGEPEFLADGSVIYNAIILDVTEEVKNEKLLEQTVRTARMGSWEMDLVHQDGNNMYWSPMLFDILELDESYNPTLTGGIEFHVGESKERIQKALELLISDGIEFDEEILLITAKGNERWNRAIGKSEVVNNVRVKIYGSFQDIHERKVAEINALKAKEIAQLSDAKFKAYTEQSPIAIYTTNVEGDCIYANNTWLDLAGMTMEEALGKGWANALHPDDEDYVKNNWYKSVLSNGKWVYEYRFQHKNGDVVWVNGTAKELFNKNNELVGYLGTNIDITEIKKSETERSNLQKTIENSLNEIYIFDAETLQYTYINKGALINLGYSSKEIEALTPLDLKPNFTISSFKELINPLETREKEKIIFFTIHQRKDGSSYPVEAHLQLVNQGDKKRFLAIVLDITERKKAENKILESKERFEKVIEATNDSIWDWDLINGTNERDKVVERFFGKKASNLKNISGFWQDNFHPEDLEKVQNSVHKAIADPTVTRWELEYRVVNENGETLYVKDKGLIIRDDKGVAVRMVGAMTDITESVQRMKIIERQNETLRDIAWTQSHVVRAPLSRVLGIINLLEEQSNLSDDLNFWMEQLRTSTMEMDQIVKDIVSETNELIN